MLIIYIIGCIIALPVVFHVGIMFGPPQGKPETSDIWFATVVAICFSVVWPILLPIVLINRFIFPHVAKAYNNRGK